MLFGIYSFYKLSWIHNLFLVQHSEFSTQQDIPIFLISISYLIFDLIFIVPTTLIILDPLKDELTSIFWIFLSMLILAIAYTMFGYTSVTGMTEANWIWIPVYTAAYLLMAIGLFWHNRLFVFDEKRSLKNWKKKNCYLYTISLQKLLLYYV
jgi:uncharacterized membrane protein YhaH (DUF805 family)